MQKFAMYFSVLFLILSVLLLISVISFNMPLILNGNKLALFTFLNSIMLVGVGVFFVLFRERIITYLQNYRREKKI